MNATSTSFEHCNGRYLLVVCTTLSLCTYTRFRFTACLYHSITTYIQTVPVYTQGDVYWILRLRHCLYRIHTSTVPIVAVGKKWCTNMDQSGFLNRQTPYSNYFEVAGGLSAVNAFGTQLRDVINLGLTQLLTDRWTPSRKAGGIPCVSTRHCLGGDNERASAGRDGRTRLESPNSPARTWRGQKQVSCSADLGNNTGLIHTLLC